MGPRIIADAESSYISFSKSSKSILTSSDGPFADIFKQYMTQPAAPTATQPTQAGAGEKVTGVQP